MKKEKTNTRTPRLQPYFTRRIGLVLAGLWLVSMLLLTVGTAQYVLEDIVNAGTSFPEQAEISGSLYQYYPTEKGETRSEWMDLPGSRDYCMLEAIIDAGLGNIAPDLSYYPHEPLWGGIYRDRWNKLNTAILFVDNEENILHQNGDFFYFYYQTADSWAAQEEGIDGYAWVDLSDREDPRYALLRSQYLNLPVIHLMYDYEAMRMTGYFEGSRFEPLSMALLDYDNYHFALEAASRLPYDSTAGLHAGQSYPVSWLDAWGLIEWDERYDHAADAPADKALVTIYATHLEMSLHDSIPVRYQGKAYADLVTLLGEMGYYRDKGSYTFHQSKSQISLWNTVVFGCRSYRDFSDYDFTSDEPWPDAELTMLTAVQASPLLIAAGYLRNVYLITAALVAAAFFWLRSLVKKHVAQPLSELNSGMADGWVHLPTLRRQSAELAELQTLTDHYHANQKTLHFHKNEIARLTAALHYAETAEDNRRQMTSHIAHELKTPLAVIHSYTEGLQEHIAEEKRDKYLEVILSETERMDAMVLEMLDLSRLEAGRVKLSRDEFSLQELCRSVFDKLELALQAKELQVTYTCFCDDTVTADEGRIRQVLENFATNAIKHTPHGGEIRIRVLRDSSGTTFSMENDGENLPTEVLDKVWDSFWRQDESRSSPGTGLGLAICKGIITLHGGSCAAYNTKRGVEFRFRI